MDDMTECWRSRVSVRLDLVVSAWNIDLAHERKYETCGQSLDESSGWKNCL